MRTLVSVLRAWCLPLAWLAVYGFSRHVIPLHNTWLSIQMVNLLLFPYSWWLRHSSEDVRVMCAFAQYLVLGLAIEAVWRFATRR